MRLFYAPGTISIAVAITLYETGLPFDLVPGNFKEGEQTKAPFLTLNPKGRVPALETEGMYLTETGAVLDYIASLAPQAGLVPSDPLDAAHMRGVMYFLASTMHVNHAHRVRGSRWADRPESHADMKTRVAGNMAENARYVASHCLRGDYVVGAEFSLADPYLFVVCSWLEGDGVDLSEHPQISAFLSRMAERPSVQKAIEQGMLP